MKYQLNLKEEYIKDNSIFLFHKHECGFKYNVYEEFSGHVLQLKNTYNNIEMIIHFSWLEIGLQVPIKSMFKQTIVDFIETLKKSHKSFFGNSKILTCSGCGVKFLRDNHNEKVKNNYCTLFCLRNKCKIKIMVDVNGNNR